MDVENDIGALQYSQREYKHQADFLPLWYLKVLDQRHREYKNEYIRHGVEYRLREPRRNEYYFDLMDSIHKTYHHASVLTPHFPGIVLSQ